MLVLTRKSGQQIVLPHSEIVFTVLEVRGDRVRIGISAPPEVDVYRQEVWERIQRAEPPKGTDSPPNGVVSVIEAGIPAPMRED